MAIDDTGLWWTGTEPEDAAEYIAAYRAGGYSVEETRVCKCPCGSVVFIVETDEDEGCARRTCVRCGTEHLICDSGEYWEGAHPVRCTCPVCTNDEFNLSVGFSLYDPEDRGGIRWIAVGSRCTKCGTLGSCVDWKVGLRSSAHLLDQA